MHDQGLKGPNFYLLNAWRKKLSFPGLKRAVVEQNRSDRGQGLWNAAYPRAHRGGHFACDALQTRRGQDHARACAGGDDQEWLRPSTGRGALARRLSVRAHPVSCWAPRRSGRLHGLSPRVEQAAAARVIRACYTCHSRMSWRRKSRPPLGWRRSFSTASGRKSTVRPTWRRLFAARFTSRNIQWKQQAHGLGRKLTSIGLDRAHSVAAPTPSTRDRP